MEFCEAKRITLFAGHYGSGKTNIAIAYARWLRNGVAADLQVTVADLDIVNPYFRTKDSAAELNAEGIGLVVSEYANSNVDFPALPKDIYALADPNSADGGFVVMDIGGDDRGALALGRYADDIRSGGDYEMLGVVNASRPLTRTPDDAVGVLREIESACGLGFTGLVNNTNLGPDTRAEDIVSSLPYAEEVSRQMDIPVRFTACREDLLPELVAGCPSVRFFPFSIQKLYYHLDA